MSAALAQGGNQRQRIEASVHRSERELARSLECLERSVRGALAPGDVVREHVGLFALGAFLLGLAAGHRGDPIRRNEIP